MQDSKKGSLPMLHGISLSKAQSPSTQEERDHMNRIPYASAIRSIMYAMLCTRSNVSYALSMTSRYQSDPSERHWIAVKNILKYLRRTKEMFLVYGGEEELVVRGAVSWKSSKQETVVWIKKFVIELAVVPSIADLVDLYYDNNGAIKQAKELRSHQRSKHILRSFHLIREIIDRGDVKICRIPTYENLAHPLTKLLV
ncbi:hypothetical protein CRG98_026744 [Punica granatum]|uniref:Retrovirus-related Pol polyprotein from transposon TNT 1-94 n=1 Tax=Punica granatum TaxID=22663 RepID=A0A2I0JAB1_PUNGR|nr:hypothetical protein CRG98_026744 [Punica granatum]